jgi:hypothetical protein
VPGVCDLVRFAMRHQAASGKRQAASKTAAKSGRVRPAVIEGVAAQDPSGLCRSRVALWVHIAHIAHIDSLSTDGYGC